jgi:hypothetical protein
MRRKEPAFGPSNESCRRLTLIIVSQRLCVGLSAIRSGSAKYASLSIEFHHAMIANRNSSQINLSSRIAAWGKTLHFVPEILVRVSIITVIAGTALGKLWLVSVSMLVIFLIDALSADGKWYERIAIGLMVPSFFVGGFIGVVILVVVYRVTSIKPNFDDEIIGLLGMLVFLIFGVMTAIGTAWCMDRVSLYFWPAAARPRNTKQAPRAAILQRLARRRQRRRVAAKREFSSA